MYVEIIGHLFDLVEFFQGISRIVAPNPELVIAGNE
jgi:hypothetical protein